MARFNLRISVYWPWLVIAFGTLGAIPWYPDRDILAGRVGHFPAAKAYLNPYEFNWQPILIPHAIAAALLATSLAVMHSIILTARHRPERATFSLARLLLWTTILASILGGLRWCGAPPLVLGAIVILLTGYPVTMILAGLLSRRFTKPEVQNSTKPPPHSA